MDTKIGVYICKGCDIGKSVDLEQLSEVVTGETEASFCKAQDILCSRSAVDLIKTDIEGEGLNRVVVAACSQRVFPELFDFGGEVLTDRVNLREHVAWSHTPNDEDTQMLAEDHIRMGASRVATVEPPEALLEETNKDLMVIGGGITGMTAAKSASAAGYKVALIEKEDRLGGWATRFSKVFPKHPPYKDLEDSGVAKLAEDVEADPNITIHKSTTVKKTSGAPGEFAVELQNGGSTSHGRLHHSRLRLEAL
jgi:quinone-modifying oxidoreductase subunit QmoB